MPSDKFISGTAEGVAKGTLEWTSEKIQSWIKKFKERKLAFIKEQKTIEVVKEQYNSGESKFYKNYIKDKDLLFLVRMGLTLRRLENDEERLLNLREKIFKKYDVRRLHVSEFIQTGSFNRYVGILIDEMISLEDFEKEIEEILANIEKHVVFVQNFEKPTDIIQKAVNIVNSHSPKIFIVSGVKSASEIVRQIVDKLESLLVNYKLERFSEKNKENLFFKRILRK